MRHVKLLTVLLLLSFASTSYAQDAQPPAKVAPAAKVAPTTAPTPAATPTPEPAAPKAEPAKTEAPKADDGEKQKFWQGLLLTILQAVFAAASPILVVLLGWVAHKFKLKIEMDKLQWVVDQAVGLGEQKLRVALKDGKEPDYEGVKAQAVGLGKDLLLKKGLAKKWGGMLGDLVEAKLGLSKLEGSEAPKPSAQPPTS
jgi:hypothetical protein